VGRHADDPKDIVIQVLISINQGNLVVSSGCRAVTATS
jgi:hypothetical protein